MHSMEYYMLTDTLLKKWDNWCLFRHLSKMGYAGKCFNWDRHMLIFTVNAKYGMLYPS